MFGKKRDDNGEKLYRYSIRKYHFGAASVAIAALIFFANGVAKADMAVSPATANTEKVGVAVTGLTEGVPPTEGHSEKSQEVGSEKEAITKKSVDKSALNQALSDLQAEIAKIDNGKLSSLASQISQLTDESKRLLGDENTSEEAVATLVGRVQTMVEQVRQLQSKDDNKPANEASAVSKENKEALNATRTSEATLDGNLTLDKPAKVIEGSTVSSNVQDEKELKKTDKSTLSVEGTEDGRKSEKAGKEEETVTKKDKLEVLSGYLVRYLDAARKIERPETKKFLEGVEEVVRSVENGLKNPQLTVSEIEELMKQGKQAERKLALAVAREHSGKRDSDNGKRMSPDSYFRTATYYRAADGKVYDSHGDERLTEATVGYITKANDGSGYPPGTFLYISHNDNASANGRNNADLGPQPVKRLKNKVFAEVTKKSDGYHWKITYNNARESRQNPIYYFTVPEGHSVRNMKLIENGAVVKQGGVREVFNGASDKYLTSVGTPDAGVHGTPYYENVANVQNGIVGNRGGIYGLDDFVKNNTEVYFNRDGMTEEDKIVTNKLYDKIKSSTQNVFAFRPRDFDRGNTYVVEFDTVGDTEAPLYYIAGMKSYEKIPTGRFMHKSYQQWYGVQERYNITVDTNRLKTTFLKGTGLGALDAEDGSGLMTGAVTIEDTVTNRTTTPGSGDVTNYHTYKSTGNFSADFNKGNHNRYARQVGEDGVNTTADRTKGNHTVHIEANIKGQPINFNLPYRVVTQSDIYKPIAKEIRDTKSYSGNLGNASDYIVEYKYDSSHIKGFREPTREDMKSTNPGLSFYKDRIEDFPTTSARIKEQSVKSVEWAGGTNDLTTGTRVIELTVENGRKELFKVPYDIDVVPGGKISAENVAKLNAAIREAYQKVDTNGNVSGTVPTVTSTTPVWVKKQIKVTYYDNENNARTNNQDDSVDYVDVLFKNIRKEATPTAPAISVPEDGSASVTPKGNTDKLVVSYRPTDQNADTTITVKKSGTTWGTLDTLPNGVTVNSSNGVVSITEPTVKDESTVTAKATYLNSDDATATGVAKNPDNVTPTVTLNGTTLTENASNKTVHVFRGSSLELPLKYYDNAATGRVNISYKNDGGLPQGVWFNDNANASSNYTINQIGKTVNSQGSYTVRGNVSNTARLGERPITLKVSDSADGSVDRGNNKEVKFNVRTYDIEPNSTKVTVDKGTTLSAQDAKAAVTKVNGALDLPEDTTYEWVDTNGRTQTVTPNTAGVQNYRVKVTLPSAETGNNTAYRSSKIVNVSVNVRPEAPTITTEEKYKGTLVSTERSISGTGQPGAKVKITLQDGRTVREVNVENNGKWRYNLASDEKLTQNDKNSTVKASNPISVKQVVNNIESVEKTVNVQMARAISVETPVQAGREIKVKVAHDTALFYLQVNYGTAKEYQYDVIQENGKWKITDSAKANITELTVADGANISEKILTFRIKDSNKKNNIPFIIPAGNNKVRVRAHYVNEKNNPADPANDGGWATASPATNTNPVISVANQNTTYISDGTLTKDKLKTLVNVTDAEDDNNKTVGNSARENLDVTVTKNGQSVELTNGKALKQGTYNLTYTTTDAAGVRVTKDHTIPVNYIAKAKPIINLIQGENVSDELKRSLLQLQDGNEVINVPNDATVEFTNLDVNTPSDNKNTQVTVVLKNGTRLSPVTLNYNVMKKFETVTKVYDFAGEGRNDSPASYYLNTGGLPGGMSWVVKRGNEAEKNADTNDNMKNMLKSDVVGTTNYKFGAKYPRGRFTNNPSETEKLSYTPTFTHEVFDVEANNDPRTQKNRVEVNNGEKLSATQAASAVVKTSNSPALPAGTTFEWVKSATDGTVLTDAEKNVTEFGEITRYVKVTLPKVSETGPNANRVQPYKIIPVTLKVNETVKPTVQMDGRRLTTNAEDNKFVIFRGATFNPTFTVNDNSGTTTYLKASGLPSGREIVKNTAMNNGTTVQISGDDAKTENKALGTYEGSIVVRDARGNNETYKFKYALVDVEVKNTPETVNKGTKLFVPGKAGESKNSHNYVKAVVSPNTDGSDVYYPGDMNFKWSKNNAEITNETVFNTPGAITYNAVVKFPNAKSDKNNVDIDGDGRNENVTIYAPDKVEKTVTFKVKPTAPEVVAKADGGVTISNTNETNVNKIQVTYTPSPTIATLTETDQDTFVEHPTTQLTASKNAQNKWSITEGAKDGISIDATSGAITINDATVKDGSQVVAKAITSDSVESAENRATAQDGDKTKPTVGLGNTLVQTGKQITLNLNVSDSGVGVDDSKVEVKNLPAGWQYNRANQTITGSIATASKTDIKVLVRDKKGNKTVKTVSLAAIQPKPIYAIKDGTIDNVGTPSNFVEMPAGVTSPSVSWKDGQPTTATAETTNKTVTVNVADYTATEVDVPVTVYPKVTLRKVDDKEVTEYHEVVGQPLTSAIWKSENAKVSPVKPDFYVAFDGEKPDGTMVEFEGGTPSERSTIAGVTHKTIKVTYPNGAGSVTKEITFKTYGNKPNYPVGKNEFETVVGSPFEKKSARDYVIKASELDNPNGIYVGWGRTGNSANPVNTNQAKVGVRTETVNIWYGNAIEKERGDNANHWFTDQNVEVRLAVKPQAPTLTANQFQGKAGTKPEITVSKLPTANQLGQDATVTVELYQGGNRVASKELSRDEVTQGAGSVHFDATNYTSNLTLGEKVHAVVKVVGGSGNTAYDLSSANSNDVQVTPQKPTFDATAVTSTSRTLSGTLGGFDATNKVVKVHLNDEKNTVLSSANTGEVTITGDKWTATIPDTVKLRQSVSKNGETTKPSGITVENTVTGETVSTTSDEKEVTMGDYSVASTIAGSKHIDITVPHDAKRVELRFHNNQETGEKPNGITLVRGADGTWHTEATRADNTTVTDANGYVGTITATPSATNPAESVITIPLNEESNGKKLHLREEAANGDNTATYGKGLGLRVEYQPEAGQDPAAAGNWKVVNVTNTAPVLSHKGTEGSSETNRKVFPSRTSITKAMLEELVTVGDPEDNAADTNNKPYGTPTVEIVSGLTETPGTATAPGNYIVTLKATDSQGRESNELTLYVEVRKQSDEHDPQAKDPQQEVSHNQEADPEKSVDKTKLPAGTSLAWKDDHKPDTSHPGNQTGIVVVTYPDGTSEDVTVTVKVKEQKDEYQPELKDPQQEVSHNQEADPEKSVDKTKLPAGTSLAWKDDHKPDTSHPGNQTGIVVVTYPDGTSEDVTVTVKVKEQKDEYQPELKDPQQEVSHNQEADPEKSVDKTKLPAGTSLAWKDDHKPDTSHPGNQTGIVVVTYPDGTSEDVTVTVKVKEQKDEYQPELKDPQQEVSHNQEADPEKSVDKTKLPAGTSLAWKDDHKPDTSHPGNQTGIVVVTYPDGTSEDVTVTVKVKEQKDEYQPELKDPQQEVSHNQEADPEKSVDKTKLPAGTSLAWKDDHKPDTSHPGNQTGIVVVTYPDGTSEDVTVTVKVKEQKDEYQPELKDPQQEVSHNQEADPEKSVDKTKLPAGTSLAWKDDHKPDTSHPGNQTGIVVVTYPDGTSEDVTVTVKVKEQKDEYQPELKDPQQEVSHNQEADPEKSVDKTKLPAGTSLAWKDDHKPDTSHPGNQTGIVVVTYPDGTSEDVTVTVKVKEQKDEYQPELKDPQQEVSHNQEADPEKSVDKTKLPAGTSLAWKDDHKPDTSHPGNQTGIVVVTYPDGTSEDVTVTVKVKEQKDEYQPELKDPQQEVSHNQEADPEKSVDKTKLPAGTSLAWKDDHKPDTSHPGNQTGIVVVTYPDGTSEDVTVTVKVKEQKDEYQPELKDPQQEVSHNQEADPEKSVDKTKLPAGTSLAWKDDHKPDTSHPGNQTGIVVVTYPDGTSEDVTVTVKVKEQKDEYQPELKDPQQEVSHNQEADPEKSVDKTKLPAGTSLAWKDDHKPDTSHPGNQTGIVVVTYPDGTSEDVTVTVKVKEQKDEYQPELKDPQQEVSHNQEADPEKSVDKTKLPAGTSLAWKDDHKPDTSHPGNQTGIVVVTYPDGTSEDVTVTVKVKEQKDEYQPELKDPQQEVSHNQEADPEKSVDKTKLPAGTSLAWKDDHKPDTSHPGNQTGIVVVTYPDGTSEDVTVTVKVKEQKDEYQPELKDPQQEVSHNQEADPEKSVDKTKLPAGTSLAWKDDHKPDTSHPGNQTGIVVVTYPDGTSEDVTVTVKVKEQKDEYQPELKDPQQEVSHNQEADPEKSVDKTKLPAGTSLAWKDDHKPDTSHPGNQTGIVVVTYPDGTSEDVTVTVKVKEQKDEYQPELKDPQQEVSHNQEADPEKSVDKTKLPAGTSLAWKDDHKPDTSHPGNQTGIVVVTYPDGTSEDVTVTVKVKEQKDEYQPELKDPQQEVSHNQEADPEKSVDKTKLPAGTSLAWKDDHKPDTSHPGNQTGIVVVTYPDGTSEDVTVTVKVKEQKDEYQPELKDPQQEVSHNQEADPEKSVDKTKLPAGTSLAWKDDHKPDTSHPGNQTGIVVVTYPDGTSEDVTVTVKVKEQKDEYQPELKDPQQEVSHNQEADPEKSVDKTKLPAGTSLAWKDDHKPDTSHPGNQTGIVVVTYPDGTSEDVTVTVKVKEQKDEYQPELKDPQQEVSHNQEADPEKSVDKTKLPAGTSLAWKDDHKPDTSHPGNQTGIVVVTYPDGTSEDVTVTVKVKEQKDEYQPELKDPQQEVSHNQEADPEKSVDKTKLPAGTSLAWKDDHKPDTSHPGNQTGIVVVTYPDGTSEDVTVTVKVKEQKDEYQPELKDPQQEVSHNQEADPEKSVDKTKLPAGTSLAWKDDHKPDTSHPGNQTGIVVVTYPDGTSEDVTVTVKVKEQKDEYQPELKDPQQEVSHNQEADPEKSVDKTKLPAGTSLAWKDDHKPDTSHPGNQTGIVVVTYPDGTSEDVTVTVKVKEQKDEYQPELKDPQQEVSHNQEADPEKSVDKTKLPAGTSLAWKDDHKPDTSHPGNQTGIVVVTYPDGTSEDVTVTVKVKEQKDEYQPELKDPQQEVSHNQEADPEKSVDKTKLPAGTSLAWKDDHKPDTSHPGNQTGIVVVTYPDGTSEDVTVTVKVKEQKDEYQPELKDPQQEVSHNQEADPEKSVDKTKLPAGTSLAWKDDHKPDTSHPGNQTGIVVVTYPDGTSEDVTVTVKVKEQKDEYQPELKDPQQEVSHNQEADPEKSVDKTKLPAGTSLAWKDDHKPDTSHPGNQTGIVVVTYPDGTSEDVTVTVKVKEQKDEYQPELKDPQQEVSHNQEADPEKSVDKTKLPAGTSLAWKDDHKPDTSHPGNQTGIVVVTYPDGTSEDVTVTVKVKEQKDEYQPELKDPQQEVSHNQEADPEKSVDKTKLPAGTSLAWKDDHKPDTSHPGNQTGIVVVTYPDGTSEDVTVTVKVKEQKDEYQPELKDPQQEVSHNQEADPEKSVDKTKLPAGTSLAWKDDHKPDTSHPGNQTGIVVVTYPDGTSEDVTVTVKVKEQKDEYQPELKDPQQEVSHNQEADPEKSVDKTKLPAGTSLAWKDDHKPDTSHPGNQTGIVVVTYPDGTSEDVTVTVKVKEQKDEYQPELKDPQQEVSHNQEADPEKSVDKTKLPAGTSLAWKDDHKPDTSHPGNQTGIVVVTYPDGTSEDVTVTVKVKEQKDEYQPELKDPQQEVSHNQEADPEKSVDKTKLPAGTSLAWKDDHKPDTSHPGNQTGIVVVTYPDGTSEDVTVTVKVKEQKDEYQPELKDPQQEVSHNQEADPEKSVDKTKLPAGTSLAWKDDHKPDTSHPGNQTGIVVVTYPDGTSEDVTVTVKVKEQKDEYQPELKDPQQEVSHNQEADPEKSVDKTKLPAGTSLAWKDDHKPDTSHPGNQTGIVVVTYPDGTSEDVTVTVKVKEQKDEYQPELKDPQQEVSHNQEADPEKSVDKTKLPAGTSLAWKDDHKPDTSHPGNQTGIVVVTYPDGTSEDVTVTVKVKEQKDEYQPELKDPQQEVSHNQEADPEKSVDKTKLPAGTSLAWKDDHKPDTSHPGNQTGIVVVTYPDGTTDEVTVKVVVKKTEAKGEPEVLENPEFNGGVNAPDSPIHEVPEFNGGVNGEPETQEDLPEFNGGVNTPDSPIYELPDFAGGVNGELPDPAELPKVQLIITKWTDEQGNELKPADAKAPSVPGEANEALEHGEIEGYVFVRTETEGDVVTHIFRKVSPAAQTGDGQQRPATPSDDTNPRPDTATPAEVPATQPAEQPSQTVEVPAQLPNEVSETDSSVSQPQAVLPNTGTQEDRATGAFGVLSLLGAFGLLFAKKKKDDEEEA